MKKINNRSFNVIRAAFREKARRDITFYLDEMQYSELVNRYHDAGEPIGAMSNKLLAVLMIVASEDFERKDITRLVKAMHIPGYEDDDTADFLLVSILEGILSTYPDDKLDAFAMDHIARSVIISVIDYNGMVAANAMMAQSVIQSKLDSLDKDERINLAVALQAISKDVNELVKKNTPAELQENLFTLATNLKKTLPSNEFSTGFAIDMAILAVTSGTGWVPIDQMEAFSRRFDNNLESFGSMVSLWQSDRE